MATTTCKRCKTPGLFWMEVVKPGVDKAVWTLRTASGNRHFCESESIKIVKCKFCKADDLHWAEDVKPDGSKKMQLTESYGLPHACDEQIAFRAKERQDKKDKYAAIKERVTATPDGPCAKCNGSGRATSALSERTWSIHTYCDCCDGLGQFTWKTRKSMLSSARNKIWPQLNKFEEVPF